jgi:hypothetical protein
MLEVALVTWGLAGEPGASEERAPGPSFSLAYAGDAGCPSRANFEAAIVARAPKARAEAESRADVRFEAELTPPPGEKRRLRVSLRDGTSQDRTIDADDCAEAVQSMAVIAAMILSSRDEPRPEKAHDLGKSEQAQPPSSASPPEPSRVRSSVPPAPPPRRQSRPTWLATGAGLGLEGAAAPSPTFAASGFVELGSVTNGWLAPSLRINALFGQALDATTDSGDARFRLLLGRVHGCGLRFGTTNADIRLCAVVEGGALFARGLGALNARSQVMGWLGAGFGVIGGWRLGPRWSLELGGGARGLVVRDEFVFAPNLKVHQPPVIAWDFTLSLAYRLW